MEAPMKQKLPVLILALCSFIYSTSYAQDQARPRVRKTPEQRLIEGAMSNDIEIVRRLILGAKLPPDTTYGYSPTVLQIAVSNDNLEIAQLVVRRGADVNLVNNRTTALHIAAGLRRIEMIKFLLSRKADTRIADTSGVTPLQLAASKEDMQVIQALLLPANLRDISANPLTLAIVKNQTQRIPALLQEGLHTYGVDVNGYLPLHYAAVLSPADVLNVLLPYYDINAKTYKNYTALMLAAKNNRADLVPILLKAKATIAEKDDAGNTPLHIAVLNNAVQAAETFVRLNAPTREVNAQGQIPLDIARDTGLKRMLQACYDLPVAVEQGNTALVNRLIRLGAYVNIAHNQGNRPLHLAVERGHFDTAQALIAAKANVNVTNDYGNAPIHLAASSGDTNMINLLVRSRARINERNRSLELPIQLSIVNDHRAAVALLKELGSEVYDGVDLYLQQSAPPPPATLNTSANLSNLMQQQRQQQIQQLQQRRQQQAVQRVTQTRVRITTNQAGRIITNVLPPAPPRSNTAPARAPAR